ncbi:MAG: DNA-methyltransferase, partial [Candidatus Helarchaeota archaeon]
MQEVEDASVHLIITSPPYGSIKDYGIKDQIGFMDGFDNYIQRLTSVWKECYRVLEPQCRLVINVGDQYLRKTEHERYRIFSIHSAIIEECLTIGFDYLGDIIWQKISTTNTTGGCSLMGSIYYPRNGLLTYDYEHILIFKKWSGKERKVNERKKELSKICLDEWKNWYNGHWTFPGIQQREHVAMFPEELPYRIIRMFSHVGDTVLDPFVGSGTTLKVAMQLKRKGIGYEINRDFKQIIEKKLSSKIKEKKRRDFHNLLMFLWKNE